MTCILAGVMPHVPAADRVERLGHGKDLGHSTLSVGNRGLRLRRPRMSADRKARGSAHPGLTDLHSGLKRRTEGAA